MIYGFDTEDESAAIAALIVYVVWRSRSKSFKITPDVWGQVERFVKDASKRAKTLPEFIEALKRPGRMNAPTLQPRYMEVGAKGEIPMVAVIGEDGRLREMIQFGNDREIGLREFGAAVIERADAKAVLRAAYRTTAFVVLLTRDRLEREKPVERQLDAFVEDAA